MAKLDRCPHCGTGFTQPDQPNNPEKKRYCTKLCKRRAKRNRWCRNRLIKRRAEARLDCPTPDRPIYLHPAEALNHVAKTGDVLYPCTSPGQVPHFHCTSQHALEMVRG